MFLSILSAMFLSYIANTPLNEKISQDALNKFEKILLDVNILEHA